MVTDAPSTVRGVAAAPVPGDADDAAHRHLDDVEGVSANVALIRILQLGEWVTQRFTFNPDLGIVAFVLVVSALLSLVYLVPWALLASVWRRYHIPASVVRRGRDLLMGSVGLLLLAMALQASMLTMVGGALTVLVVTGLATVTATRAITRRLITS